MTLILARSYWPNEMHLVLIFSNYLLFASNRDPSPTHPSSKGTERGGSASHPRYAPAQDERDGNALTPTLYPQHTISYSAYSEFFFPILPALFRLLPPKQFYPFVLFSLLSVIISLGFAILFFFFFFVSFILPQ